jgi:hypothetical protein
VKIDTFLGPEMASREASVIWAPKNRCFESVYGSWIRVSDSTTVDINHETVSVCTEVLQFLIKTYIILS